MRQSVILRFVVASGLVAGLPGCNYSRTGQPTTVEGARPESLEALSARLERRIAAVPGAVVGVAYHDLHTGDTLHVNADSVFHAASTMKVPVMIELFRAFDAGRLRPDQRIVLGNQFKSIVDGSPYSLDAVSDSDSLVYTRIGREITILELNERIITQSSNLATNTVIQPDGAKTTNATARPHEP